MRVEARENFDFPVKSGHSRSLLGGTGAGRKLFFRSNPLTFTDSVALTGSLAKVGGRDKILLLRTIPDICGHS